MRVEADTCGAVEMLLLSNESAETLFQRHTTSHHNWQRFACLRYTYCVVCSFCSQHFHLIFPRSRPCYSQRASEPAQGPRPGPVRHAPVPLSERKILPSQTTRSGKGECLGLLYVYPNRVSGKAKSCRKYTPDSPGIVKETRALLWKSYHVVRAVELDRQTEGRRTGRAYLCDQSLQQFHSFLGRPTVLVRSTVGVR